MTSPSYPASEDPTRDLLRPLFDEDARPERERPAQQLSRLLLRDANAALASMGEAVGALLSEDSPSVPAHLFHEGVARLAGIARMLGVLEHETCPSRVHLNALVGSAVTLFRSLALGGIPVTTRLEDPLPSVWGDALELERALLSLLLEASDGASEGSFVVLSTGRIRDGSAVCRSRIGGLRVAIEIDIRSRPPARSSAFERAVQRSGGVVQSEGLDDAGYRLRACLRACVPEWERPEGQSDLSPTDNRGATALAFPPFYLDLVYLAEHPLRLVTQRELIGAVWGRIAICESLIRTHVHAVRRVLGDGAIETVSGRGYRFTLPVTRHKT
jgi:hypothetical protein